MSDESPRALADLVLRDVEAAVRAAKQADAFHPVMIVTWFGMRRLRLEIGRRLSTVNVRVVGAEQFTGDRMPGETVILVRPGSAEDAASPTPLPDVVIPVDVSLDLSAAEVVSCPDASVECRVAVSALLDARCSAVAWSSMAVAVVTQSSQPMLLDALRVAGVPFHVSRGRALLQSAAARFVAGAIEISGSSGNRGAVSALWSSVPLVDPATGRLVPVMTWERLSRRWGVVDAHDWRLLVRRCVAGGAAVFDVDRAEALSRFVEDLSATIGHADADELALGLSRFLPSPNDENGRSAFGPHAYAEGEATDVLRRMLVEMPDFEPTQAGAAERIRWFERSLAGRSMQGTGRVGEGVQIGSPEAMCFGSFDEVVVVGLSDEAARREGPGRLARRAALAMLVNGRSATLTVPRSSARSQREVAPLPELLEAFSDLRGAPITAEDLHMWPSTIVSVQMIPSWQAAVVESGSRLLAALNDNDVRLTMLHSWTSAGGDLLAHPLVETADGLKASLSANRARRSGAWTAWDGGLTELSGWSPVGSVWSVTRLEQFHQCRLRVFLTDILGARPLDRPEDDADPDARSVGTFVHKVMETLTNELLHADVDVRPSWQTWLSMLGPSHLTLVMQRAVDDLRAEGKLGRGPWWDAQVRWLEARLRHYLAGEVRNPDGFEPVLVESGPTRTDPWILATPVGDVRLQGRADRIERRGVELRVVDFKTGSLKSLHSLAGSDDPLDGGRKLQLPVYAAMEADRNGFDVSHASGVYVNPLNANRAKRRVDLDVAPLIGPAKELLASGFASMAEGMFTYETVAEPGNDRFCLFCDVKSCCPVERITFGREKLLASHPADVSGEAQ